MTLSELPRGQTRRIVGLGGDPETRLRIQSMGLRIGQPVSIVRRASFGGPLQVRLGTTDILIRPQQASQVALA